MALPSVDLNGWGGRVIAFVCGIVLHHAAFRRGEWDMYGKSLITSTALLYTVTTAFVAIYGLADNGYVYDNATSTASLPRASYTVSMLFLVVFTGLFSSILIYRAFFHRLCRFPGPFSARLSNAYLTWKYCRSRRLDLDVQRLHQKYGDVVRVGPRELSINDPESLHDIHSSTSLCTKGPWYNVDYPAYSLQETRIAALHTERRKAWDTAFMSKCRF